jgi:hypothetical protein
VVHEIGKARTTVVCDRNNLHEAKQRRRNGYGMHLVTGHLDPSRPSGRLTLRPIVCRDVAQHPKFASVRCGNNSRYVGTLGRVGTTTVRTRSVYFIRESKVRQQMTSASARRT